LKNSILLAIFRPDYSREYTQKVCPGRNSVQESTRFGRHWELCRLAQPALTLSEMLQ
jgi:hypothetical protein